VNATEYIRPCGIPGSVITDGYLSTIVRWSAHMEDIHETVSDLTRLIVEKFVVCLDGGESGDHVQWHSEIFTDLKKAWSRGRSQLPRDH
jgi:hypothetical protein